MFSGRVAAILLLPLAFLGASCSFDTRGRAISDRLAPDRQPRPDRRIADRGDLALTPLPDLSRSDLPVGCAAPFVCKDTKTLRTCIGPNLYAESECPLGCDQANDRCFGFEPSSGVAPVLALGQQTIIVAADETVVFNTDTGTVTPSSFPAGNYYCPPATPICALTVRSLEVKKDGVIRAVGSRPFAILARETILVEGLVDVSATGTAPGAGGGGGGEALEEGKGCGHGYPGHTDWYAASFAAGSGGSFGSRGGTGGGGPAAVTACGDLCPVSDGPGQIAGGSGGGGGGNPAGGAGGAGGGGVQLTAEGSITITGTGAVAAGGGGGRKGSSPGAGPGGGGGSGGGILLEAPTIEIAGILAAGGGGGGGGALTASGSGHDGANGTASAKPAAGGEGAGKALLSKGGRGGNGSGATEATEHGSKGEVTGAHGGGGGGSGRICLRSATGQHGGGQLSPQPDGSDRVRQWALPPK
jgi:hypothetical protein